MSHTSEYTQYIESGAWKAKRVEVILKQKKCLLCGEKNKQKLVVHHRHYRNFKDEKMEDLIVLCNNCHNLLHASKPRNLTIEEHTNAFFGYKANLCQVNHKKHKKAIYHMERSIREKMKPTPQEKPVDSPWIERAAFSIDMPAPNTKKNRKVKTVAVIPPPKILTEQEKARQDIIDRQFAEAYARKRAMLGY